MKRECSDCNKPTEFTKAGKAWSGRTKIQRYLCKECGRIEKGAIEPDMSEESRNEVGIDHPETL